MEKSKMIAKVCEADLSDDKKTFLIDSILNGKLSVDGDFYFEFTNMRAYIIKSGDVTIARINFDKKEVVVFDEIYDALFNLSGRPFTDANIGIIREVQYPITSSTIFINQDNICYLYDSVNVLPYIKFVYNDSLLQYYSYVGSVNAETAHILNLLNMKHNTNQKNYITFVDFFLSKVYFHTSEPIMNIVTIIIYIDNRTLIYYNSGNRELYTLIDKELRHNNYLVPYNPVGLRPPQKEQNPVGLRSPQQKQQKIAYCDMFDSSDVVKDKHLKRFAKYVKSEIKLSNSNKVQFTLDKYETKFYKDWLQNLCANKGYKIKTKEGDGSYMTDVTIRLY